MIGDDEGMSTVAKRLYATDDTFREVADLLFGGGADELISKLSPDQADLHSPGAAKKDRNKRRLTAGLSAVGASAGAAGLGYAAHKTGGAYKVARAGGAVGRKAAAKKAFKEEPFGTALVPLEVAGLGGEVMATKILHGDTKKKDIHKSAKDIVEQVKGNPKKKLTRAAVGRAADPEFIKTVNGGLKKLPNKVVSKANGMPTRKRPKKPGFIKNVKQTAENANRASAHAADAAENVSRITGNASKAVRRGKLAVVGGLTVGAAGAGYGLGARPKKKTVVEHVSKSDETFEVTWRGEISKVDEDKRQVFGWASVVEMNGEPVVDLQGDYISIDEIEKSAYAYVQKSRKGGDMHRRNGADPHHVSDMIESFLVTPEKKEKMGLPDSVPTGWWVGYQVHDDDTWNLVKSNQRSGFSIHGSGVRKAM